MISSDPLERASSSRRVSVKSSLGISNPPPPRSTRPLPGIRAAGGPAGDPGRRDPIPDLLDLADAGDLHVSGRGLVPGFGPPGVVLDQRLGLFVVDRQALADGLLPVVVALDQGLSGRVVLSLDLGRVEEDVIGAARREVHAAAAHAADDLVVLDVDLHHRVDADLLGLQRVCLDHGPGKSVEEESLLAVRLRDPLLDQAQDDVIRDQTAGVHDLLGLQPQRSPRLHRRPQHVAGRDLRDPVPRGDVAGLRALSGTGTAQENDAHGCLPSLWGVESEARAAGLR
jgi:hypothetical protein